MIERFGLIIPTLNAGEQFRTLLEQIAAQSLPTQKLIVDSESSDGTARQLALEHLAGHSPHLELI